MCFFHGSVLGEWEINSGTWLTWINFSDVLIYRWFQFPIAHLFPASFLTQRNDMYKRPIQIKGFLHALGLFLHFLRPKETSFMYLGAKEQWGICNWSLLPQSRQRKCRHEGWNSGHGLSIESYRWCFFWYLKNWGDDPVWPIVQITYRYELMNLVWRVITVCGGGLICCWFTRFNGSARCRK